MYAVIRSDSAGNRIVLMTETEQQARLKVGELTTMHSSPEKLYWYAVVNLSGEGSDPLIESTRLWSPMDGVDKRESL